MLILYELITSLLKHLNSIKIELLCKALIKKICADRKTFGTKFILIIFVFLC